MAMPPCGTFDYMGVVPVGEKNLRSGRWTLEELFADDQISGDPLEDNRLVGWQPQARIDGGRLTLEALSVVRAQVRSVSVEFGAPLLRTLLPRDAFSIARTAAGDIGASLLRDGTLIWAVGTVTAVPVGPSLRVVAGPPAEDWPNDASWVDVSADGQTFRLRDGEALTIGDYDVTVVRTCRDDDPGDAESVAISYRPSVDHEHAAHAARLLARAHDELEMEPWPD